MDEVFERLNDSNRDAAIALARLPLAVKGYGPVWEESHAAAMRRRNDILAELRSGPRSEPRIAAE